LENSRCKYSVIATETTEEIVRFRRLQNPIRDVRSAGSTEIDRLAGGGLRLRSSVAAGNFFVVGFMARR
jgi:hypothetical protein